MLWMDTVLPKIVILFSLFLLIGFPSALSQDNPSPVTWTANWIWHEAEGPPNTWMCFRKSFSLEDIPSRVSALIAVDSKYWLTINEQLVVFEGGLNRGPTPTSGYFDQVDIQSYLHKGENTIALLVWYWGNEGRNNVDSGQGGLLFQSDMGDFVLTSDRTWKLKVHPAYGYVPFQLNAGNRYYLYGGWNIGFDARLDMPGWTLNDYDDSLWFNAVEKGVPPCQPWNELVQRPIPLWEDSGLLPFANADDIPTISDGTPIWAKLPYNAQVTPYFKIDAAAGQKIKIQTDHYDVGGYYGQRAEYITKDGQQEFEMPAWQNGEHVVYDFPAGVRILDLKYRETGYATTFAGSFLCDDEFYNTLAEKAQRTLYVCMRDNYMDCPDRERGQWIGDVATYIPLTFFLLDRRSDVLTQKCVNEFVNWRDGPLLKGLAPGSDLTEYASQSLNAISDIGIMMTYYQHTGDLAPIQHSYAAIKDYLNVWHMVDNGRIQPRATWNGQGSNVDHVLIETTWYYMALKSAKAMAQLTGHVNDIPEIQARMDSISAHFDQNFWQGDAYRSGQFVDDRANGLVVLSGLAGIEKYDTLTNLLQRYKYSGPYMEGYIIEALCKMGAINVALNRIKEKYGPMVKYPETTTLWEAFWWIGSSNHAWSGAPLKSLFQYIVGVAPITPGYESFQVMPQLGFLKHVDALVPSIKGDITVRVNKTEPDHFVVDVQFPPATTPIVGIPKNAFAHEPVNAIEANGVIVWRRGYFIGSDTPVSWAGEDHQFYKFKVESGPLRLTALRAPLDVQKTPGSSPLIEAHAAPNPFNSQTVLTIKLAAPLHLTVAVYDMLGHQVDILLDRVVSASEVQVKWDGTTSDGRAVASGVYLFHIKTGEETLYKKMLLIR